MNAQSSKVPAKTMRTASIIILFFGAALLLFGMNMFQVGSEDPRTAQALQAAGLPGTVIDVRVQVGRTDDGELHAGTAELTFEDATGESHTLETNHYPRYQPRLDSPHGFVSDFPTKDQIIGQPVTYRLGDRPAVELTSLLPSLSSQGWSFPNYLGVALMVMGSGAAIGGVVSLVRANRRLRGASGGSAH